MRAAVLLLAAFLFAPGTTAIDVAPDVRWDHPADARAHLISPQPGVQTWPSRTSQGAPLPPPGPVQTSGTARVLVLLVDFTDTTPTHSPAYFTDFFNDATPGARSVQAYYKEVSFGLLTVQATVIATWFGSARTMSYYGADGSNPPDDASGPIYRLVTETVQLADPTVDFAPFDTNLDGVVDHLVVVHAGGAQESGGSSDLIWSHRWAVLDANPSAPGSQPLTADNVQVYGYIMVSEDSPIGVVAHEFGHDLGLPDLYDTDGSSEGAGVWDVMSGGSWNGFPQAGSSPAHLSAWSRLRLGWATPTDVTTSLIGTTIDQVETSGTVFRLRVSGTFPPEYFLVENRQQTLFDAGLPGSGLLIWHVDEARTSNQNDAHRWVDLEEADESISGDRPKEASDPWRDSAAGWGPATTPDSRSYSGAETGWRVRDISASGATMTATIARDITKDLSVSAIRVPFAVGVGTAVNATVSAHNDGAAPSDVNVDVRVYRDAVGPTSLVTEQTFTRAGLAAQATVNFSLAFTPASTGRYVILASVVGANDEIPSNDERAAHVLVNRFDFSDDVESGNPGWTANDAGETHEWRIVNETDPNGAAHSRTHAWRFGFVTTLLPPLFPLEWHTLTSPTISLSAGPTFLIVYHRYDLTGRTVPALPIGSNDTDDAYIEVSYDGGPWVPMAHFAGRDLVWRGVSFDLTPNITAATDLRIRFNASANVMGNAGGWWIDDVVIAEKGLGRAVLLLGSAGPHEGPAGGAARFTLKVANVGDYETDFRLDATPPTGWDATVEGEPSGPLQGRVIRLAPDNDLAVRIRVMIPSNATSGALDFLTISATAVGDPNATATLTVQVRVSGLPLELVIAAGLGIVAILFALVAVVAIRRRRRPPT